MKKGNSISLSLKSIQLMIAMIIVFPMVVIGSAMVAQQGQDSDEITNSGPPIYIAFHWHMHQPIYWPYESVVQTESRGSYSFSLREVHTSRSGPYTDWPKNAVASGRGAGLPHFGAQVSFSGSLVENLNAAEDAGWGFNNWKNHWNEARGWQTELGNPALDIVGFGYHHPLMPLITNKDVRRQIQWHRDIQTSTFNGSYSKGIFPPETAFSTRIIPALVQEGFEWAIVDNLHFERASQGAPVTDASGVLRPNRADVRNPNPGDWVQLNGVWAPTPISAQWAHQPRYVAYTDPQTGEEFQIIAVPASRYLGEEDGRGGYGALNYESVMSQLESYNTDPDRPILLVLHHDGDNHGGGSSAYYNSNFQNMVSWLQSQPNRFKVTTIQDYLDRFPPDPTDVIHVQDGSWLGADGGDPQFRKWLGAPGPYAGAEGDYSPDANSWGVMTAAQNVVYTADQVNSSSSATQRAWELYLNGQASDYWYWDGTEMWDSHPSRAANQAVELALPVAQSGTDLTPPSIFLPQRTPYNPGELEFGNTPQPSDFSVWTYVFDISGLEEVSLHYRVSTSDHVTRDNLTYSGGASVGEWQSVAMSSRNIPSITNPIPTFKADEFSGRIEGYENVLIDYYVEAVDTEGNVGRSIIQHVWVGDATSDDNGGGGSSGTVTWNPTEPTVDDVVRITLNGASGSARLHWGVNAQGSNWQSPHEVYHPDGSALFGGTGPAVQSPFADDGDGNLFIEIGPFNREEQTVRNISFVINYSADNWDNNNNQDYRITLSGLPPDDDDDGGGTDPEDDWTTGPVRWNPVSPTTNDLITVRVDANKSGVLHWGVNGWSTPIGAYRPAGTVLHTDNVAARTPFEGPEDGVLQVQVGPFNDAAQEVTELNFVISYDDGTWDSAGGNDYRILVSRSTSIEGEGTQTPLQTALHGNYPNPFNPSTTIRYDLAETMQVRLSVFDVLGREVAVLVNGVQRQGVHATVFDAGILSSGVYVYRLQTANQAITRKMMFVK